MQFWRPDSGDQRPIGPPPWRRLSALSLWFLGVVVFPTVVTATYYALFASDRYVAEAKFIVRGVSGHQAGGLASLFQTFGIARADDDAFAVHSFMMSRDAVRRLDELHGLRALFGREGVDLLSRYPRLWRRDSFEALYEYYQQRVEVSHRASTGISTLRVVAFTADDAERIASSLLGLGEGLINRMNDRANADALNQAQNEVARAEKQVIDAQGELTRFRNRELMLDPSADSLKALERIGGLAAELAQTRLLLNESLQKAPSAPAIQSLHARVSALQGQITSEKSALVGRDDALAAKMATYERLTFNREFAERSLGSAFSALETARQEARRKHIYIETVASPLRPDEAIEPRQTRITATVFVVTFALFSMVWLVVAGSREHMHG